MSSKIISFWAWSLMSTAVLVSSSQSFSSTAENCEMCSSLEASATSIEFLKLEKSGPRVWYAACSMSGTLMENSSIRS